MALEAVQAQAGHRSIESTRIYLHLSNDWLAGEYRPRRRSDRHHQRRHRRAARRAGGARSMSARCDSSAQQPVVAVGRGWDRIARSAPTVAGTMGRYLGQIATSLAPRSVDVADITLRQLAGWLLDTTEVRSVAAISRNDIEDFKVWLAAVRRGRQAARREHSTAAPAHAADVLRTDHRMGLGRAPHATRSSVATSPPAPNRCPSSSTTLPPRSSWPPLAPR